MDRFCKLSKEIVEALQNEAQEAQFLRDDIERRAQEAFDVVCGRSDAFSMEEAFERIEACTAEREAAPVPAYIRPVKRWAGGDKELDLWYWDTP